MSRIHKLLFIFVILILGGAYGATNAQILKTKLKGEIVSTKNAGETLWYIYPKDKKRYGARDAQFLLKTLKGLSVPISQNELQKIPLALPAVSSGVSDSDSDGIADELEVAIQTNPFHSDSDSDGYGDFEEVLSGHDPLHRSKKILVDMKHAREYSGSVLRSETAGEDIYWYVHPHDMKRYVITSPDSTYALFQSIAHVVGESELSKIPEGIYPFQSVAAVIDGDTIELESGKVVRYIGIDTPETAFDDCYGKEATDMNRALVEGREVYLVSDRSFTDEEGRLLMYVTSNETFINEFLVREGFAFATAYAPDIKYSRDFFHAQREAKEARRGLWGNCWHPESKIIKN